MSKVQTLHVATRPYNDAKRENGYYEGLCIFCGRWIRHKIQGGRGWVAEDRNGVCYMFCKEPRCPESEGASLQEIWACPKHMSTVCVGDVCGACKGPRDNNAKDPWSLR